MVAMGILSALNLIQATSTIIGILTMYCHKNNEHWNIREQWNTYLTIQWWMIKNDNNTELFSIFIFSGNTTFAVILQVNKIWQAGIDTHHTKRAIQANKVTYLFSAFQLWVGKYLHQQSIHRTIDTYFKKYCCKVWYSGVGWLGKLLHSLLNVTSCYGWTRVIEWCTS